MKLFDFINGHIKDHPPILWKHFEEIVGGGAALILSSKFCSFSAGFQIQIILLILRSFQFSSVTQICPTLCNPMDCSTPSLLVYHQLPEFAQTHVHWVGDAIQPSHCLASLSPPAFNLSQHHGLLKWVSSSHQVAKVLKFQLQHQSFQWIFRTDFL